MQSHVVVIVGDYLLQAIPFEGHSQSPDLTQAHPMPPPTTPQDEQFLDAVGSGNVFNDRGARVRIR